MADARNQVNFVTRDGNVPSNWVPEKHYKFVESSNGAGYLEKRGQYDFVYLSDMEVTKSKMSWDGFYQVTNGLCNGFL